MKKNIKRIHLVLSVICVFTYVLIVLGNIFIPKEIIFYDNQTTAKFFTIYQVTKTNNNAIAVSNFEQEQCSADVTICGLIPVCKTQIRETERKYVHVGGSLVGIRLFTEGLLVVGIDDVLTSLGNISPALECGIQKGDIITKVENESVSSVADFSSKVISAEGKSICITVKRGDELLNCFLTPALSQQENKYRCGLWLRDSTAGIGTLTFADPENKMVASLGHAICDSETESVLPVGNGDILGAHINGCIPGEKGITGQIKGSFTTEIIGKLYENNQFGVYGTYSDTVVESGELYPVASQSETEPGYAQIISTVSSDGACYYDIEIEKITFSNEKTSRSMVIKVTDPDLLNVTGGIVQGMSGSPIIQNGMIVGAVTHVFLNDPQRGYGIFIENMLSTSEEIAEENKKN